MNRSEYVANEGLAAGAASIGRTFTQPVRVRAARTVKRGFFARLLGL